MDRKARDIIGLPVVTFGTGGRLARVEDLIIDPERRQVLALVIDEGGFLRSARAVPFGRIQAIGPDVVIVADSKAALDIGRDPVLKKLYNDEVKVRGLRVLTDDGQRLGEVADVLLDDKTGEIRGYYVATGRVVSMTQGLRWVPVESMLRMGKRILYVPASVATDFENQVGGIQGALDQVGDRVRTAGSRANARLEEVGGRAQQAGSNLNAQLGQLGDQLRETLPARAGAMVAGRTAHETVTGPEGTPIVNEGDTITDEHVEQARQQGRIPQLIKSAGIGPARADMSNFGQQASDSFGDIRREASDLWAQLTGRYSAGVDQTDSRIMERRIKAALGRPTTRVILDQEDNVILNTGDIITNRAVEAARQAGVLDILVTSAYTAQPELGLGDMKAPHAGDASLESQTAARTSGGSRPRMHSSTTVSPTTPIPTTEGTETGVQK